MAYDAPAEKPSYLGLLNAISLAETEAGIYRRAEITGESYKVFSITGLMPKTDFDLHIAKMTYNAEEGKAFRPAIVR